MHEEILDFWFEELEPRQWWEKDDSIDQLILKKFAGIHAGASRCELFEWRNTSRGRLAEILVLDQFSRNMFRGTPSSFSQDSLALALAQEAILLKADAALTAVERSFLYMPFMHSESMKIHEVAVELFKRNGIEENLNFELQHKEIIERFGRYPHRNKILGRTSTADEITFLTQPNSSF